MTDEERKEYHRQYSKERYKWLKEHRICTRCGSEEAIINSTLCPGCSYKSWLCDRQYYEEHKQDINRKKVERWKQKAEEWKKLGLCNTCGGKIERSDKKRCNKCISRDAERHRKKMLERGGVPRSLRDGITICTMCGKREPMKNKKVCAECDSILANNLVKTPTHNGKRVDNYFTQTMSLFFNQK